MSAMMFSICIDTSLCDRKAWASDNLKRKLYLSAFKVHSYLEPRQKLSQPRWHGEIVQNGAENKAQYSLSFGSAPSLAPPAW